MTLDRVKSFTISELGEHYVNSKILPRQSLELEGSVDVTVLELGGDLDPSKHTMVTYKENKNLNFDELMERVLRWFPVRSMFDLLDKVLEKELGC